MPAKSKRSAALRRKPQRRVPSYVLPRPKPLPKPDSRLKKIYVYDEGTFRLTSATDVHKLVVTTRAFDLAGWIDLNGMAPGGDSVTIELRASFANRTEVLYLRWLFESPKLVAIG